MTGANRSALDEAGISYTTIHTHPANHAGYFPGSTQMHLIVHMDPDTGRILGAQGVGEQGVDKRIDILATAIRAGLAADSLIDLDLCYSPPYGSAKDPVSMIGYVADNVLSGQTKLWYPEQLEWARTSAFILDARTAKEFATGHLPEAVNIPHVELRDRLDEVLQLAAGRPIAVMCQSGVRSYIAHRILVAHGFDSQSLSGGMLTLRSWLGQEASSTLTT
jgi:rhodanese-related sulfurtransferase